MAQKNNQEIYFDTKEVNELFDDIATMVESGQYFDEAKKWYAQKYILIYVQKRFLFLISILTLFSCYFVVKSCQTYFPLEKKVPLAIENSDPATYYFELINLSQPKASIKEVNEALINYLVKEFVENFESYDSKNNFAQLEKNRRFINNYGSKELLNIYDLRMDNVNIDGFKIKYHKNTKREVIIENSFVLSNQNPSSVEQFKQYFPQEVFLEGSDVFTLLINFTAYERNVNGNNPFKYIAMAKIKFPYIQYNKKKKDFEPVQFQIMDYKAIAIK